MSVVRFKRVVGGMSDLRPGKQHLVVCDTPDTQRNFSESCNNCFAVYPGMTRVEWDAMIHDFNEGNIRTLIVNKVQAMSGWKVDKHTDDVDVVFTYRPEHYDILRASARLKHFHPRDVQL